MGSFQTFLYAHPLVDYAWELFKGLSPTLIALLTIYINDKRNVKNRKRDWEIKKAHEAIDELMVLENSIFNISKDVNDCLCKRNPDDRWAERKIVYSSCNSMINRTISFCDSYTKLFVHLDINIDLEELRPCIDSFQHEMFDILDRYISEPITDDSLGEINASSEKVHRRIEAKMSEIAKEIAKLMK